MSGPRDRQQDRHRLAEARAVLETAVDAIITIDRFGQVESFNQAAERLFGWHRDEILGENINRLMPPPHREGHDGYLARYLETGEGKIIGIGRQLEALTRAGKRVPIHLAVSEYSVDGERRFTGIIRDLTELERANEKVRAQNARLNHAGRLSLMGEMTAAIAHEINQPLTAISMYAEAALTLMGQAEPDIGRLKKALSKMSDQSLRAGAVIERIQRFVRGQAGERHEANLNDLLRDTVSLAENDARLHGITIQLACVDSLPTVTCDPVEIQQVALNLIRNAIDSMLEKRTGQDKPIDVSVHDDGDTIRVDVRDFGTGVAPENEQSLFSPFVTTKSSGMGMGLSICASIIDAHAGRLDFHNNDDGGATFFFELPREARSE